MARAGRRRKPGPRYPGGKLRPPLKIIIEKAFDISIFRSNRRARIIPLDTVAVYVITAGSQATKIGMSIDAGARAKAIQVEQDRDINVFWAVRLSAKDARLVEATVPSISAPH